MSVVPVASGSPIKQILNIKEEKDEKFNRDEICNDKSNVTICHVSAPWTSSPTVGFPPLSAGARIHGGPFLFFLILCLILMADHQVSPENVIN